MQWCQAVSTGAEEQTLGERAISLRYTHVAFTIHRTVWQTRTRTDKNRAGHYLQTNGIQNNQVSAFGRQAVRCIANQTNLKICTFQIAPRNQSQSTRKDLLDSNTAYCQELAKGDNTNTSFGVCLTRPRNYDSNS